MSFELPIRQRDNLREIDRDVRSQHWRWLDVKVDAAKCSYQATLNKVRERCGEELWAELMERARHLNKVTQQRRENEKHGRNQNPIASNQSQVS